MTKRGFSLVALAFALPSCGGAGGLYVERADVGCRSGHGDDCWQAGEMRLHKTSWAQWGDLPIDAKLARKSFRRGCELNSIRACASLIERHLVDDQPEEKAALMAKLEAAGVAPRTDEEVAGMDKALADVVRADVAQKEKNDRESLAAQMKQLSQSKITGTPGHLTLETPEQQAAKAQLKKAIEGLDVPGAGAMKPAPTQPGQKASAQPAAHAPSGARPGGTSPAQLTPSSPPSAILPPSTPSGAGPQCAPLGAACNAKISCCGQGQGFSIGANDCPRGTCCAQNSAKCTVNADCCNVTPVQSPAGVPLYDVCGRAKVCCRPKGVPSNDDGTVCCNGGNPHSGCL